MATSPINPIEHHRAGPVCSAASVARCRPAIAEHESSFSHGTEVRVPCSDPCHSSSLAFRRSELDMVDEDVA